LCGPVDLQFIAASKTFSAQIAAIPSSVDRKLFAQQGVAARGTESVLIPLGLGRRVSPDAAQISRD
jgi:hypothetical protein